MFTIDFIISQNKSFKKMFIKSMNKIMRQFYLNLYQNLKNVDFQQQFQITKAQNLNIDTNTYEGSKPQNRKLGSISTTNKNKPNSPKWGLNQVAEIYLKEKNASNHQNISITNFRQTHFKRPQTKASQKQYCSKVQYQFLNYQQFKSCPITTKKKERYIIQFRINQTPLNSSKQCKREQRTTKIILNVNQNQKSNQILSNIILVLIVLLQPYFIHLFYLQQIFNIIIILQPFISKILRFLLLKSLKLHCQIYIITRLFIDLILINKVHRQVLWFYV
ncbi:unnamed protein product [Paramecium primaurelia]|uniref:Transmembrane protein n=1 Tax=Paramecium primaurelia TaxID=5886 RepID=A0A8S1QPI8_PARPR|nr:unnamed protein product [Paramecium primaurelia]